MAKKHNGGFSLVETVVSMAILGALTVPTCTALVMSIKLNDKTEAMLQAQLAVSSAVETLMAEGYDKTVNYEERFPDVNVALIEERTEDNVYYCVQISDDTVTVKQDGTTEPAPLVTVETTIRAAEGGSTP